MSQSPEQKAIDRLADHVSRSNEVVSVMEWRKKDQAAMEMPANAWLVCAIQQLRDLGFELKLIKNPPRPGERFSHTFCDAIAPVAK
jgi:hypothetical protein